MPERGYKFAPGIEALFEPELACAGGRRVPKARPGAPSNRSNCCEQNKQRGPYDVNLMFICCL